MPEEKLLITGCISEEARKLLTEMFQKKLNDFENRDLDLTSKEQEQRLFMIKLGADINSLLSCEEMFAKKDGK